MKFKVRSNPESEWEQVEADDPTQAAGRYAGLVDLQEKLYFSRYGKIVKVFVRDEHELEYGFSVECSLDPSYNVQLTAAPKSRKHHGPNMKSSPVPAKPVPTESAKLAPPPPAEEEEAL